MTLINRLHGASGIKIIVGSAFFWAWLDAMFMSAFFLAPTSKGFMSELALVALFVFSIPPLCLALTHRNLVDRLLSDRKRLMVFSALGGVGSLLFIVAGLYGSWPILLVGGICAGSSMAVFQLAWGGAYCKQGARSALPFAAGGFACAIIIDIPLLFMIPEALAVFSSLLPVVSGIFLLLIESDQRAYKAPGVAGSSAMRGLQSRLKSYLGLSIMLVGAVMLVMISFGYMQHLVSFSLVTYDGIIGGVLIQIARGVSAVLMLLVVVLIPQHSGIIYRVGLLAMIAGFMMMPFWFGTSEFWVSGAIVIVGYTAFDLLLWVVASESAFKQSSDSLKTIATMRLIAIVCTVIGIGIAIALIGNYSFLPEFASAETTVVGYLVVIAAVLVLSSDDMRMLYAGIGLPSAADTEASSDKADSPHYIAQVLDARLEIIGLTAREKEIATFLAYGRTQPWIAEHFVISENTVGTHVRHIYRKAQVHNRQEFIDSVSKSLSRESGDTPFDITE